MHDGAAARGVIHHRDVFLDAVVGFHLEAPPVGPQRAADAFLGEPVRDLVGLDAVVESRDLVAELLRDIEHRRHLVGAVAVVVHEDVAAHHLGERLELEVLLRRLRRDLVLVALRLLALSYFASLASYSFQSSM